MYKPPKNGTSEKAKQRYRDWRRSNPLKRTAHRKVDWALSTGRMVRKPCERCGNENSHAHHDDYSRPLDVMWLCPKHHFQRHTELDCNFGQKLNFRRGPRNECSNGHEYKPETTRYKDGFRRCRICIRNSERERKRRKKEERMAA